MSQLRPRLEPVIAAGAAATATRLHAPAMRALRVDLRARASVETIAVALLVATWSGVFGWLAVMRHLGGGTHAEDLGFTDQVIWNFLRGQWFRMSLYGGATWNTEVDVAHLARPDSLLAFHVEPMLLAFVPLYALGGGAMLLLIAQAIGFGLGAVPAFRLGRHYGGSPLAGFATAVAYLLSPFGQSAVLSDFHTSALAAPLLVLAGERALVARANRAAFISVAAALSAREDVGPAVALFGLSLLLLGAERRAAWAVALSGVVWTAVAAAVLLHYSGGVSPFGARYGDSLGNGLAGVLSALSRPESLRSYASLLLSGAWLGVLAPATLSGAVPTLVANALSSSPWMASSAAHYGVLLLPFSTLCVAVGVARARWLAPLAVLVAVAGYFIGGYGPLAPNYAPAHVTPHAQAALDLADAVPGDAAVSASTTLAPHLSHRARLYLFPTILDADYVVLDLQATSAPTSPGDVYLHVRDLLRGGGWRIDHFSDGLLLLQRDASARGVELAQNAQLPEATLTQPRLLSASLVPSPDGSLDVDGPHWILRTTWQADQPLAAGTRLEFWVDLNDGERRHVWDIASLWWTPPDQWIPGQAVTVDIPDVPLRRFVAWRAAFSIRP